VVHWPGAVPAFVLFACGKGRRLLDLLAERRLGALVVVETSDVIFAIDSVPAVLAVTSSAFVAYSSNAFAVLGLRALYFALEGLIDRFVYVHYGLAAILAFVGAKLLLQGFGLHVPIAASLLVILVAIMVSIVASLVATRGGKSGGGGGKVEGRENGETPRTRRRSGVPVGNP
jgi:tellurite resistance protein TerC